ncbi:MAG: cellulase N-terminal Ig-like domain-containing protein, partial [Ignavibacterium sp.]
MCLIRLLITIVLGLLFLSCNTQLNEKLLIRLNQVGFLPDDYKSAIIISKIPFEEKIFRIKNSTAEKIIFEDSIKPLPFKLNPLFNYSAIIEFSDLKQSGDYFIEFQRYKSYSFRIDTTLFNSVRDSLSLFFKVQRCGPTTPLLHNICHLQDATKVIGYSDSSAVDLTGGWHDA